MATKQRCCGRVSNSVSFHTYGCSNSGKVERNGKWYCGIHDPEKRAAKDAARQKKWTLQARERNATYKVQDLVSAAGAEVLKTGAVADLDARREQFRAALAAREEAIRLLEELGA